MDLYGSIASAPCRSVLLTGKALGIDINIKETNLMAGEHLTPQFLKMNPQHTVPTLDDHGFYLWESRAIMTYLVEKYGKGSTLIPSDPQQRAVMNQRMYFDMGTLYQRFGDWFYPQHFAKQPADPEKLKKLEEALGFLNTFLAGHKYAVGDSITLADLTLFATITTVELGKIDFSKYPNIANWLKLCKSTIKGHEVNSSGVEVFKKYLNM